ncbi:recombinase family protein [Gemella morbillorum]
MIYGYARVSTRKQQTIGNSLEEQTKKLKEQGNCDVIIEEQFSGKTSQRPKFQQLLKELKEDDVFVVTKLDRFARSLIEGSELIEKLLKRGVKINILNIGYIDNTPTSKLIRNIFFSFAEFERDLIIERTQEGKAIARLNKNFKDGRPKKFSEKQLNHAVSLLSVMGGEYSYNQVSELTGISKSTIQRAVKNKKK